MDKELLFKSRLPEADVDIPGVGTVRVRGLSRIEAMHVQEANGTEAQERRILAIGMVDPELTESEVGQWQKASIASELEPVSTKIAELSGLLPGADKATFQGDGTGSEPGIRPLPSPEAGDDGGQASDGNGQ
jgi:hypothetical protein